MSRKAFFNDQYVFSEVNKTRSEQFRSIFHVHIPCSLNDGGVASNLPAETISQSIRDEYIRDTLLTVACVSKTSKQPSNSLAFCRKRTGEWTN